MSETGSYCLAEISAKTLTFGQHSPFWQNILESTRKMILWCLLVVWVQTLNGSCGLEMLIFIMYLFLYQTNADSKSNPIPDQNANPCYSANPNTNPIGTPNPNGTPNPISNPIGTPNPSSIHKASPIPISNPNANFSPNPISNPNANSIDMPNSSSDP